MTTRAAAPERRLEIMPPEGVPLGFELAGVGERFAAFVVDQLVLGLLALPAVLWLGLGGSRGGAGVVDALALLWVYGLLMFGPTWFELSGRGTTPGKRRMGLRVVDAEGQTLEARALVARNLVRHVEVWLPVQALLASEALLPNAPGVLRVASIGWLGAVVILPFVGKERTRAGDLVAGTRVVRQPVARLLGDVAARTRRSSADALYTFTADQLAVYGTYELQVLEDLLRMGAGGPGRREAMASVRSRIAAKIGDTRSSGGRGDDEAYLHAYYAALRGHLEGRLLLGLGKRDKHSPEQRREP